MSCGWRRCRARRQHRPAPLGARRAGRYQHAKTPQTTPQDHEPYDTMPRGSLLLPGELPSTWDLTTMNVENYRAVTVALSIRLRFGFGWLVGDGERAMVLARNVHGHEWGDLFFCSGGLRPGYRVRNRFYQFIGKTGYRQYSEAFFKTIGTTGYFEN